MLSKITDPILQRDLYQHRTQSAKKMSGQNLAFKDFRNRMKEKRSGGKRKSYYRFKKLLYFTDTKAFSRKLGKYK